MSAIDTKKSVKAPNDLSQMQLFLKAAKVQRNINARDDITDRSRRSRISRRSRRSQMKSVLSALPSESYMSSFNDDEFSDEAVQFQRRSDSSYERGRSLRFEIDEKNDNAVKIPWYLFSQTSALKLLWSLLVAFVVVYVSLTIPVRLSFMQVGGEPQWMLRFDLFIDLVLITDLLVNFLTVSEDQTGETIVELKILAYSYLQGSFIIDAIAAVPGSFIALWFSPSPNQLQAFLLFNLVKLFKVGTIFEDCSLARFQKGAKKYKQLEKFLAQFEMSNTTQTVLLQLVRMATLLHFLGCLFSSVATSNAISERYTWIKERGLENASMFKKYLSGCYWAVVTISTNGYGDITPQNNIEHFVAIVLVWSGVSMYSYIVSRMTTLFSSRRGNESRTKEIILEEFFNQAKLPLDLRFKLAHFFKIEETETISLMVEFGVEQLLGILPINLKSQVSYYLFRDAIEIVKVFQDRDQRFYSEYMTKLKPLRVKVNTTFAEEGAPPTEVYFLLTGCVRRTCSQEKALGIVSQFLIEGAIFGECDVLLNRLRTESFTAEKDSYVLTLESRVIREMMEEFDEFRYEIEHIAKERERFNHQQISKAKDFLAKNKNPEQTFDHHQQDEQVALFRDMKKKIRKLDQEVIEDIKKVMKQKGVEYELHEAFVMSFRQPTLRENDAKQEEVKRAVAEKQDLKKNKSSKAEFEGGENELPDEFKTDQNISMSTPARIVRELTNNTRLAVRQSDQTDLDLSDIKGDLREKINISSDLSIDLVQLAEDDSRRSTFDATATNDFFQKLLAKQSDFKRTVNHVKELLQAYRDDYEKSFQNMREIDNEALKKAFARSAEGLGAYLSLITIFDHYLEDVDIVSLKRELHDAVESTKLYEDCFFHLTSQAQAVEETIERRNRVLSQELEKASEQKPLVFQRGQREERAAVTHLSQNQQLINKRINF